MDGHSAVSRLEYGLIKQWHEKIIPHREGFPARKKQTKGTDMKLSATHIHTVKKSDAAFENESQLNITFSKSRHDLKNRIYRYRYRILAGVFLLLFEICLIQWAGSWAIWKDTASVTGSDFRLVDSSLDYGEYCMKFSPTHDRLKCINLVLLTHGTILGTGNMSVAITDADSQVLLQTEIPYKAITPGHYYPIDIPLHLLTSENSYYLFVTLDRDQSGLFPCLPLCNSVKSNSGFQSLTLNGQEYTSPPLVKFVYETFSWEAIFSRLLILALTLSGLLIGLPRLPAIRRAAGALLLLLMPPVLGIQLELISTNFELILPHAMRWNIYIMYLLELILLLCTQSFRISVVLSSGLLTLLYSVNYYVLSYRGVPVRINDIYAAETASNVLGRYDLRPGHQITFCWCICMMFLVFGMQTGIKRRKKREIRRMLPLASGLLLAIGCRYLLIDTDFLADRQFKADSSWELNLNYQYDGFLVASLIDIRIQSVQIAMPENYSSEKAEELLADAQADWKGHIAEELPHIILVMNESFSDLRVLGNLQISEENLPFFHSLKENTIRGYVNASVFGSGTATSEFEVLTGCTMGLLSSAFTPYQQCITRKMPSLISNLKEAGYTTYSIHPENRENWNRNRVYQYFGFDHSLWKEDFQGAPNLHMGATDAATYEKVIEIFENRRAGEKLFLFDLTMQNHGGYSTLDTDITVTSLNAESVQANLYLSLIRASDRDLEMLVRYFAGQEEPVIICMYGDHQPKLDDSFYESIYAQTEGLTERDMVLNKYKTPFIIWANYDIPEQEGMEIGMSYLGAMLMDIAGVPVSPYFHFLQQYMQKYPVITVNGYTDHAGNHYDWSKDTSQVWEYSVLQYHYLFDEEREDWGY